MIKLVNKAPQWLKDTASILACLLIIGYGVLQLRAGRTLWENHNLQPVTPYLVIATGGALVLIKALDILLWRKQRRDRQGR